MELDRESRAQETGPSTIGYYSITANETGGEAPDFGDVHETDELEGQGSSNTFARREADAVDHSGSGKEASCAISMKTSNDFRLVVSELLSPILIRAKASHSSLSQLAKCFLFIRTISLVLQLAVGVLIIAVAALVSDLTSQTQDCHFLVVMSILGGLNVFLTVFMMWNLGCKETHLVTFTSNPHISSRFTRPLLLQVSVGVLIIALSPFYTSASGTVSGKPHQAKICALGGSEVILAATLLYIGGSASGEPYLGLLRARELDKFIRECEYTIIESGHLLGPALDGGSAASATRRYSELLAKVDTLRNDYDLLESCGNSVHGDKMRAVKESRFPTSSGE